MESEKTANSNDTTTKNTKSQNKTNVVTIPVPIVNNQGTYAYIALKGSLHDNSCSIFGLSDAEIKAVGARVPFNSIINGIIVRDPPIETINILAKLGYKVLCSSGEAEICWTMQREI